ncbi:MAG: riboflavin synthase [Candidatus Latescibacteria bacterium]|nr:riboflavin synthase [Candidatus Latescibacterota bacterium]
MFTGIIEEIGTVLDLKRTDDLQQMTIQAALALEGAKLGDSINIEGVCQTVVAVKDAAFVVESVRETLERTTLGALRRGDRVNLERSLRLSDRLGGHLVMGHVDGVARIVQRTDRSQGALFGFELSESLMKYIAPRGSVAVDGMSLTVSSTSGTHFEVSIIPHTLAETTLFHKRAGDRVNVEVDMLARYVESMLQGEQTENQGGLTINRLEEMGF